MASLEEELSRRLTGRVLILGMGNELRADDGAGAILARRLANRVRAAVLDAGSALESFLTPVLREAPDSVVIVDAVHFDGYPGEVRVFHAADLALRHLGTHGMSPGLFLDILGENGVRNAFLVGIQPRLTVVGHKVTPAVQSAIETLDTALMRILGGKE